MAEPGRKRADVLGQLGPLIRDRGVRAVARAVGISHPTLSRWLTGGSSISVAVLEEIADALDLEVTIAPRSKPSDAP